MTQQAKQPNIPDDILTPEQAAAYLKIPAATLCKWRSTGEHNIPYYKIGRLCRYKLADLKDYVDRHVCGAA